MHKVSDEIKLVRRWHDALNRGDVDALMALVHDDVEVGGSHSRRHGLPIVREWAQHGGATLKPEHYYQRGDVVVVEAWGEWRSETGDVINRQNITGVFTVKDGRITRILRYNDKAFALAEAGLTLHDAQRIPGAYDVVMEWHDALRQGNFEELAALMHENVEISTPDSTTRGLQAVLDWLAHEDIYFSKGDSFGRENIILCEESIYLRSEGKFKSDENIALVFSVTDEQITRIIRYDDVDTALAQTGMTTWDRFITGVALLPPR